MNRTLFRVGTSAAFSFMLAGVLAAQSTSPGTTPRNDQTGQKPSGGTVSIVGCLMSEADVPALSRGAGGATATDQAVFILTSASTGGAGASAGAAGATRGSGGTTAGGGTAGTAGTAGTTPGTTPGTPGTAGAGTAGGTTAGAGTGAGTGASGAMAGGAGSMYRISGLSRDQLKPHVGHQVEISGQVQQRGAQTSTGGGAAAGGATTAAGGGTTPGAGSPTRAGGQPGAGTGTDAARTSAGMTSADLPELQATSIKMISATCSPRQQ